MLLPKVIKHYYLCADIKIDKVFLLTLKKSTERRNNFLESYTLKLPLEVIWGEYTKDPEVSKKYEHLVDPTSYSNMYKFDSGEMYRSKMNDFNSGALGAYLGHLLFYTLSFEQNLNYTMVFEDNVLLLDSFETELNEALKNIPSDFDVCFFHTFMNNSELVLNCNDKSIKKISKVMGAKCYLINVKSMKNYYKYFLPIDNHVDLKYTDLINQGCNIYYIPLKSVTIQKSKSTIAHTPVLIHPKIPLDLSMYQFKFN